MLIKAALPEIEVSVVADACAGVTPDTHSAALTTMKMCQINIV
jgi:nicotinamidase-related amidase